MHCPNMLTTAKVINTKRLDKEWRSRIEYKKLLIMMLSTNDIASNDIP